MKHKDLQRAITAVQKSEVIGVEHAAQYCKRVAVWLCTGLQYTQLVTIGLSLYDVMHRWSSISSTAILKSLHRLKK